VDARRPWGLGLVSDVPLNGRQVQDWNMPTIRNLAYCKQGQAETEDDRSTLEVAIFAHVNHVEVRPRQPVGCNLVQLEVLFVVGGHNRTTSRAFRVGSK
jgi:hypothetical protein